jgi:hypothetical protein
MTVDEIIEKVEAEQSGKELYYPTFPCSGAFHSTGLTTDNLKLLANHAKALAEAEKVLEQLSNKGYDSLAANPFKWPSTIANRALPAISRIKEGRG